MHFSISTYFLISVEYKSAEKAVWDKVAFFFKYSIIIKKNMLELHLVMVIFGMNLVSNISTKVANKASYSMPNLYFFNANCGQMKDK